MGIEGQFSGPHRSQFGANRRSSRRGRGNSYLYDIRRFAMLEKDQEYELAKRWREARRP